MREVILATTIQNAFNEYKSNLEITERQTELISNRRKSAISAIKKAITLHHNESNLIGSYDRNTLIRYLSEGDVDVMVILHYGDNKIYHTNEGASRILTKIKNILEETFPAVNKRIDRNCVRMKYSEFILDIVPAFSFTDATFRIPDSVRQQWLKTDPVKFAEKTTSVNKNMDGCFIPLIKMIKGWNRENGFPLKSFHLECMMLDRYKDYTQGYTYPSMIKVFFENINSYLLLPTYDPITLDRVDLYLDNNAQVSKRDIAIKLAKKAAADSKEAFEDQDKYPSIAVGEWKALLGSFFPSYG
jgi:hypothetical protein